ncbi:MAG: ATPase [Hyphomonadaceae bacterium]|nr:ATPase [Hyphomonadaceae bacterium]
MTQTLKRFYKQASIVEAPDSRNWQVQLDARSVRTPAGAFQAVPTRALAEAMAEEWARQGETVDIAGMHLTRLTNVAIDRAPSVREGLAEEVARFCETDLTCHLEDRQSGLRARQDEAWKPLRDWVGRALGVMLLPVEGLLPAPQPDASLQAARAHALSLDDFRLTGLAYGCGLYGSAVLGLAVERGEVDAVDAFQRSRLEEAWQAEHWGEDSEAAAATAARLREAEALAIWFAALQTAA